MSGPPVRPRSRELEIVRVMFDKHLLERAVNLAEARWAGSGDMIRLAYHWQDLAPAERREQLERIGPEQLSQFRALAELDPDLARVLESLEERGVLAPTSEDLETTEANFEGEAEVEPVVTVEPAQEFEASPPPPPPATETFSEPINFDDREDIRESAVAAAAAGVLERAERQEVDREEVLRAEQARRAEAMRSGEELLQRVRARLDSTARKVTSNPIGSGSAASPLPAQLPARISVTANAPAITVADEEVPFAPPPEYWIERLANERVVVVEAGTSAPTDDQLVGLSNEFGLELHEFVIEAGTTREQFGGLKRSGTRVDVRLGPIPTALAMPSLVVIRGRLFPRQEARMRDGICDIPGTRKSVPMDADARVIVIA